MPITFCGANIRGAQGGMPDASVESDLTVLAPRCDVLGVQEFQLRRYWTIAARVLGDAWDSYPTMKDNAASDRAAIKGGQAILWRRDRFEKVDEYVVEAFRLADSSAGIMPDRYIRAALLRDRQTGFTAWYCSTHFVVDGDKPNSPAAHKVFLEQNLTRFRDFLLHLKATGHPIVGEIDANISAQSPKFPALMAIFAEVGAVTHGVKGIEYGFTVDNTHGRTGAVAHAVIQPKTRKGSLFTDHEARLLTFPGVPAAPTQTPAPVPTPVPVPVPTPAPPKETPVTLPSSLPQTLRDAGLKVVLHPGWERKGRPGAFDPVGVLCHHTATRKSTPDSSVVNLLTRGRSDLPGPLAQFGLARDGSVHFIAAGRSNHAGKAKASGSVAGSDDGNRLYIGIEAFNDGVGEPWPKAQYDAYVLLAAVLSREVTGNSAQTVRAHKETSKTGKVDPLFPMDPFRASVAKRIDNKPASPTKEAPVLNSVQKARLAIAEALAELNRASALLNTVDQKRVAARSQITALAAARVALSAVLKRLPAS